MKETHQKGVIVIGSLALIAILAVLGIVGLVLIAINPVFRMIAFVGISAAVTYYLAQVIALKKPEYFLGCFFGLIVLFCAAPSFLSIFPETNLQVVTGELALTTPVLLSSLAVLFLPVVLSVLVSAMIWGKAKTTFQRGLLSLSAVMVSMAIVFLMLMGV